MELETSGKYGEFKLEIEKAAQKRTADGSDIVTQTVPDSLRYGQEERHVGQDIRGPIRPQGPRVRLSGVGLLTVPRSSLCPLSSAM